MSWMQLLRRIVGCRLMTLCWLGGADPDHAVFQWVFRRDPPLQSAFQRTYPLEPQLFHLQRHPGAGLFTGSSAYQHELAFQRQLLGSAFDVLGKHIERSRDATRVVQDVERMSQV